MLLILPGLLNRPKNVLSIVNLRMVMTGSCALGPLAEAMERNVTSSAMHPGYGKKVFWKPRISTRVEDTCSSRSIMACRVKGQLAASSPSKIPASATIPSSPQRTYLPLVLVEAVVAGGATAIGMADYLDAERGYDPASRSVYLVDQVSRHFPRQGGAGVLFCQLHGIFFSASRKSINSP